MSPRSLHLGLAASSLEMFSCFSNSFLVVGVGNGRADMADDEKLLNSSVGKEKLWNTYVCLCKRGKADPLNP